jgi:hypothetical protein
VAHAGYTSQDFYACIHHIRPPNNKCTNQINQINQSKDQTQSRQIANPAKHKAKTKTGTGTGTKTGTQKKIQVHHQPGNTTRQHGNT